ncbi:hypothetical protein [Microbacterium sp.]|uniref:hypothetical protein n=1 Tax=Microbacterium sp. TaxID=51671 RepID=UPI0028120E94|nr:hypothetical protein [Microbacterium sp.]
MSTDDPNEEGAATRVRWPMSPVNTVLVGLCIGGAVVCFVSGLAVPGWALLLGGVGGGIGALLARRSSSSDLERVNALEYADERDRAAAAKGLAVVGVASLVLTAGQLVVHAVADTDPAARWASVATFLALAVVWLLANWYFVRRG